MDFKITDKSFVKMVLKTAIQRFKEFNYNILRFSFA
jgi:hypothetical protein